MTEQEKREKAMIEEVLSDEQIKIANDVNEFAKLQKVGISVCYAEALYDAGYRKAKEIFAKCKEKCMFEGYPYGIDYTELVEVFKEFGVEVEE